MYFTYRDCSIVVCNHCGVIEDREAEIVPKVVWQVAGGRARTAKGDLVKSIWEGLTMINQSTCKGLC